tara:strand:- start:353 stop:649 length:297 start_codon:yes stop_codon:yes gene_type:complete
MTIQKQPSLERIRRDVESIQKLRAKIDAYHVHASEDTKFAKSVTQQWLMNEKINGAEERIDGILLRMIRICDEEDVCDRFSVDEFIRGMDDCMLKEDA